MGKSSLKRYAEKRDFKKSPEPAAKVKPAKAKAAGGSLMFCVQKHLASHLHYDFRLEHDGVLLSWAVPKGPSLNPADKRMAVHVEDHPVDYGDFEGVIPSGYGAGVVMLWDKGTWTPEGENIDADLKRGELKFTLGGVKLKGSWVLVRTKRQPAGGLALARPEQWLLIKHRDKWAGDLDIAQEAPDSVKSFHGYAEILAAAGGAPEEWNRSPPAKGGDAGAMYRELLAERPITRRDRRGAVSVPAPKSRPRQPLPHGRGSLSVSSKAVPKLSNQTKVLYPKTGFTKGDVVAYYRTIAPLLLPQLKGRATTLKRYPDGVDGKSFFEKNCAAHRPDWMETVTIEHDRKTVNYCVFGDERSLIWAANLAALELHTPLALAKNPERPTALVFDLDPGPPATMKDCVPVALRLKAILDHLGLASLLKTSGGKGLHILVPLNTPGVTFDDTKTFARALATMLEKETPTKVIASMSRAARAGKVFLDWSQNDWNKTTVCVFSLRARDEPTVSWPIDWAALDDGVPTPVRADDLPDLDKPSKLMAVLTKRQKLPAILSKR